MAVYAITLGFMPARIIERSLRAYSSTRNPVLPYRHVIVDHHYPVDKERNRVELRAVCDALGAEYLDPGRNLGLHGGINWALTQLAPADDDIIIGYDGDSLPISDGWDMALVRAIHGGRNVVWSSLMNPRSEADLRARGFDRSLADGYIELHLTRTAVVNSICAWRFGWLRSVGFLDEPLQWYGHLEAAMWAKLRATGKQWAFLPGWRETDDLRDMHDRAYVVYKWHYSHLRDTTLDFESWLTTKPEFSGAPAQIP
jgi:hypothetical protein